MLLEGCEGFSVVFDDGLGEAGAVMLSVASVVVAVHIFTTLVFFAVFVVWVVHTMTFQFQ
jgi:F0F1-type ATP synthase assembly protein I